MPLLAFTFVHNYTFTPLITAPEEHPIRSRCMHTSCAQPRRWRPPARVRRAHAATAVFTQMSPLRCTRTSPSLPTTPSLSRRAFRCRHGSAVCSLLRKLLIHCSAMAPLCCSVLVGKDGLSHGVTRQMPTPYGKHP